MHVATVAEFPSLSWLAPTPVEAPAGLANVVRDVLTDLAAYGEPIPEPLSERAYSADSWCVFRRRFTAALSAKLPNSM